MRKFVLCILLFFFAFTIVGCHAHVQEETSGKPNSEQTQENNTSISDADYVPEEGLTFAANLSKVTAETLNSFIDFYKNNTYQTLYEIDGIQFGRIIASSDSAEDAVNVCTRHFTDNRDPEYINTVVECNVIYESDLFYGIHVTWAVGPSPDSSDHYEENVISFKKNVADITVRNVIYNDEEAYRVCTDQDEQIKQILLYLFYNKCHPDALLHYEMSSDENAYRLTVYAYYISHGDWDLPDRHYFVEQPVVIDKTDGTIVFQEYILLNTIEK